MLLRKPTLLAFGAALLAIGGVAAAQSPADSRVSPPAPPAAPTPPEAPYVDRAEIDREVAEGMAEARAGMAQARAGIAEARHEIAAAREEIMHEKDMPARARAEALAALDKAERDVTAALGRRAD
ncbi:MAG: hypothetical protein K2X68_04710 [Novosphingobium sp.]|nr:hypothetical protein [Novosphingobium sp.]